MENEVADKMKTNEGGVRFSVGRFYKHSSGLISTFGKLGVLGVLPDLEGGSYMIARTQAGEVFKIIGFNILNKNYVEITPKEFYSGIDEGEVPEPNLNL